MSELRIRNLTDEEKEAAKDAAEAAIERLREQEAAKRCERCGAEVLRAWEPGSDKELVVEPTMLAPYGLTAEIVAVEPMGEARRRVGELAIGRPLGFPFTEHSLHLPHRCATDSEKEAPAA